MRRVLVSAWIRDDALRALNANAYAERFVRSIKEECLEGGRIPIGDRHFHRAMREFVLHYHTTVR